MVPADDSGLWGSERFLLEAELVAIDQRYLTFSVEPPADSIAAIRALTPGAWATATSSHQPMAAADAVEAVAAYAASPADVPGPRTPPTAGTASWCRSMTPPAV